MDNEKRRRGLLKLLQASDGPVTGSALAEHFGVSRQVIVSDIAILRAAGAEIIATPQGYLAPRHEKRHALKRIVASKHGPEFDAIALELNAMVDEGAKVIDVIVEHPVYGELHGLLMIASRRDVTEFIKRMQACNAEPLSSITGGVHLHTLEADTQSTFDRVEEALRQLGMKEGLS